MRTKLRSKASLLFVAIAALLAIPAVALADQITNNVDTSADAVAETMSLNQNGDNGTTRLYIVTQNLDGKNGCNLTGQTSATVSLSSSDTSVATVDPSSVTFTSCVTSTTGPLVTVTPHNAGTATISGTLTSNTTAGSFDVQPITFTVNVAPPPNTPPNVMVSGVTGGASYNKGSVPNATCQVTDAEDGNSSFAANLSSISGPYASDGIGEQTASCSYTDAGNLTATDSVTYGIIDPSAPSIGYQLNPATPDGANGWYNGNVSLTWNVSEPQSPSSLQKTGCVDQNIIADQGPTEYTCSATSAGGSAGPETVTIKRDGTAPVVSLDGAATGTQGDNGWYTSAVTQQFKASDATSGLPAGFTTPFSVSSGTDEGSAVEIKSGAVTDNAGNTNNGTSATFKIDLSDPTNVAFVGGPAAGGSYDFGDTPAAPTCSADDAISGLKNCVVTGYDNTVGTHTLTATATDNAGRTATATRAYTVKPWTFNGFYQPVDMSGIYNTVKGGSTVPFKFELFKGTTELTDTASVKTLAASKVACDTGAVEDSIELTATGGTSLRYDTTAGQYVYNWQTPKAAGSCYKVTITANDGSAKSALFKLK